MGDAGQVYDGFISYSHAADDLLAPRLQSALQRFAKPWWKRRAVRVFRDESSLSANPHLWSSITEALDRSRWFILLLSPDAAQSEWVNQEIEYWKTHCDTSRILPVVTDGEFRWGGTDVGGASVPATLRGLFNEEPRWVDLRFVREEEQLDLKNPRFSNAVADIASALRGVAKDELESEEVRQHRRTVRTAWAAGVVTAVLAVAAVGFGVESNQNEALARSREYAGAAVHTIDDDPELATRLAVYAASVAGDDLPQAAIESLWRAGLENRLVDVIDLGGEFFPWVALSPDRSQLAIATSEGRDTGWLEVRDASTLEVAWTWTPSSGEGVVSADFSPDGRLLAASVMATEPEDPETPPDGARIEIIDVTTGSSVRTLAYPGCAVPGAAMWSPDAAVLAIATVWLPCDRPESSTGKWVEFLDTESWDSIRVDELPPNRFGSFPVWTETREAYIFGEHPVRRYASDLSGFEDLPVDGFGDVSPDGSQLATYSLERNLLAVYDADDLTVIDRLPWEAFPRLPAGILFTSDGQSLIVSTEGHETTIHSLVSGRIELTLPTGTTDSIALDEVSGRIYTSHANSSTIKVWSPDTAAFGMVSPDDLGEIPWVNGNAFRHGIGVSSVFHIGDAGFFTSFFDQATGEFLGDPIESWGTANPLPTGNFVYQPTDQTVAIVDPLSGTTTPVTGCPALPAPLECDDGLKLSYLTSLEGDEIAVFTFDEAEHSATTWAMFDGEGVLMSTEEHPVMQGWVGFSDEVIIYRSVGDEQFVAIDRLTNDELWRAELNPQTGALLTARGVEVLEEDGLTIIDPLTGEQHQIAADLERPRGWEFGPDGSKLAIGDEDRFVVLDTETSDQLHRIPLPGGSDFYWLDEETVLVGTKDGVWGVVALDTAQLLSQARAELRSGFTDAECQIYSIDPCPTLEKLRGP